MSSIDRFEHVLSNLLIRFGHRALAAETGRRTGRALPPASWALLDHLNDGGPMRVSALAACHGVDVSSVTPRLQALEAEGLIERSRDASDGRVSVIAIGAQGRAALARMHAARVAVIAEVLDADDHSRLPQLIPVLERISNALHLPQTALSAARKDPDT